MSNDSATTPRPDPDRSPPNPPDEVATVDKPVPSPRRKPATAKTQRKPRSRQSAKSQAAPDKTATAETDLAQETPPELTEPVVSSAPAAIEIATPAARGAVDTLETAPPAAAVDPVPDHAPPAVAPSAEGAAPVDTSAAGPVTLAEALASDGVRRVVITISYLFSLVGALAAFGVVDSSSPRLSAVLPPTLSLLAAATQADRLWWVVLLGLAVYVGWLWLPGNAADPRSRAMAYPSAVTMLMLGIWFFLVRSGELFSGSFVSLLVVGALMVTLRAVSTAPSRGFIGRQCAQLGFAAALGWMTVLTAGAIAGALVTHKVPAYFVSAETWGILGTTALLGVGMAQVRYFPGRLYTAAALSWGFVCIAYARVVGEPRSYFVGVVALVSAVLILIAGVAVYFWARGRARDRSPE